MNYIVSIIDPESLRILSDICDRLALTPSVVLHGRGTATPGMLDLLGIESNERRIVLTVANDKKTKSLMNLQKQELYIGMPGRGVVVTVPIKSVGGEKTMTYLNNGEPAVAEKPTFDLKHELIVVIANEGTTDLVMDAAREAGARGGTVLHGKGTGSKDAERFYHVSIATEKEVVLIVASVEEKAAIMRSILKNAGPDTAAGAITFSLPIGAVAGIGKPTLDEEDN